MYNTYDEVIESKFHNKKIKIQAIVTGKTLVPYHVPKVISVKCLNERCKGCQIQNETDIEIDASDNTILKFIDVTSKSLVNVVKEALGIRCKNIWFDIKEMQLIDRIYIDRPTGKERTRKGGGTRPAYVIGVSIETNCVYELEGYTTTEPVTQSVTHVFTKVMKVNSDIESFNLSVKKHKALNEFCVGNISADSMFGKLEELYTSYAHNVTKIYERFDLHLCVDMIFRSVISFYFDNEYVHKGWLEAMIIGDTRCGKGYVAEKLVEYFGLGEVVSGENATFAGLVGGLQQFNKHWIVTWGKIPLNDMGLVVIDETSGLMEDIWGKLSRIRSEGIAEITKIRSEVSNARTRLLFICNPPTRTIASYSYGIQSIQELVKAPEDIARFDYVLVVAHDEVSGEKINQRRERVKQIYDQKLEQDLILWCWSRKSDEVRFTKEAIKLIYDISKKLEKVFDFSIPLIQVENVRFKLAKLAIAFAARFYSNIEDGRILLVKSVHVECAYGFFYLIYGKEQSGYMAYSTMKKSTSEIVTPEKLREVEAYFDSWKLQKNELLRCLLINNNINPDDIVVHLGCRKEDGNECVSRLLKAGCLTKKVGYYVKTSEFTTYLKRKLLK